MLDYASKEATLVALKKIGFVQLENENFFDSPGLDSQNLPVVQIRIYICGGGYYCVDVGGGGFRGPCVWNGPRAAWDNTNTLDSLTTWLDEHHAGWR